MLIARAHTSAIPRCPDSNCSYLSATNCVLAGNGGHGIYLHGEDAYQPGFGNVVLDAGDPASYPAVDILGIVRPQKAGPSMGAYESGPALPQGTMLLIR